MYSKALCGLLPVVTHIGTGIRGKQANTMRTNEKWELKVKGFENSPCDTVQNMENDNTHSLVLF